MIVLFTLGTRGDIQPYVGLGVGLQRAGHAVRIVTSESFAPMILAAGLAFAPLTGDFKATLASDPTLSARPDRLVTVARIFRARYAQWARDWIAQGREACRSATLLIGSGSATLLARSLAEAHDLPFVAVQLQPLAPSRRLPPLTLGGNGLSLPGGVNLALYRLLRLLVWRVMCPAVNGVVRPALGLPRFPWRGPPQDGVHGHDKVLYGFSEQVLPRPDDWEDRSQVVGYWFHDDPSWAPPSALQAFLDAGPRPVYIGFGSMVGARSREFTDTLLDGLRKSGQRAVLVTGWGGLSPPEDIDRERVFVLDHAPHDRLLPLMSAAVHHGGAGTSAAAARAGIPSVVIPFFGDQPFWARRLHGLGVAPPPLDRRRFTGDDLAHALRTTQQPTMQTAAATLGQAIRAEDSVARTIDQLHRWQLLPAHAVG